jgi:hypothetical protein
LAKAKADERKQRTRLIEVGAMLEPLGERVAALTLSNGNISSVSAGQLGSLDGNQNNQHQGDA